MALICYAATETSHVKRPVKIEQIISWRQTCNKNFNIESYAKSKLLKISDKKSTGGRRVAGGWVGGLNVHLFF